MAGQRTHGTGGVFRRKKNGKYLPNWYIAYYNRNGRQQQESTRQPLKAVASCGRTTPRKSERSNRWATAPSIVCSLCYARR